MSVLIKIEKKKESYQEYSDFPSSHNRNKIIGKKIIAASRVRTCAGRSHWISSPTP